MYYYNRESQLTKALEIARKDKESLETELEASKEQSVLLIEMKDSILRQILQQSAQITEEVCVGVDQSYVRYLLLRCITTVVYVNVCV